MVRKCYKETGGGSKKKLGTLIFPLICICKSYVYATSSGSDFENMRNIAFSSYAIDKYCYYQVLHVIIAQALWLNG